MTTSVLKVENLRLLYETMRGRSWALTGVDFGIQPGEVLGLVGESGCGKSSLALAIMQLLPQSARAMTGKVLFKGQDILSLTGTEMETVRGSGISMIFQEPLTSLNPLFTIGDQLRESIRMALRRRKDESLKSELKEEVSRQAVDWLRRVGIPDSESAVKKYPHELSGGMRQRVMIAMAMASRPSLLLADEPTSALDVTTQAQILQLIQLLIKDAGTAVIFISHDLAVIAQIADRVAVMYAGMLVEESSVSEIFENPLHPYTQALLSSFPRQERRKKRLETIPGSVPELESVPARCPFDSRCKYATSDCLKARPHWKEVSPGHHVACILF